MKLSKRYLSVTLSAIWILVMILDSKTSLSGAMEGVSLCLEAVIPALFPFAVLATVLTGNIMGMDIRILRPIGVLCGIPEGAEGLLAVGFLGGYPVGAQCIAQAYESRQITKQEAHRMLAFCSNAGPAFLFGIVAPILDNPGQAWLLWGIHIISALITGSVLPGKSNRRITAQVHALSLVKAVGKAAKSMAGICSWIILMRVFIAFCNRWFLWLLPPALRASLIGILELTNGCFCVKQVIDIRLRALILAGILGFGGICVWLQTASVVGKLGTGSYLTGKLLHGILSCVLAMAVFWDIRVGFLTVLITVAAGYCLINRKKDSRFLKKHCV